MCTVTEAGFTPMCPYSPYVHSDGGGVHPSAPLFNTLSTVTEAGFTPLCPIHPPVHSDGGRVHPSVPLFTPLSTVTEAGFTPLCPYSPLCPQWRRRGSPLCAPIHPSVHSDGGGVHPSVPLFTPLCTVTEAGFTPLCPYSPLCPQ